VGCPRDESRVVSRERTRYGYTQVHSGGRSRSDASRALPTSGSQDHVAEQTSRALARRKLEASPDGRHEWVEGETVRGIAFTIKSTRWFGQWASQRWAARRFSIRRKMFSGFCPYRLHRQCEAGSFGSQVNPSRTIREERVTDSASVGTEADRACLRVTTRASDGRHGLVKAPRGPRRSKGSSHPRR